MKLVIMGAPSCGKGVQAKLIQKDFDLQHISTGQILRDFVKENANANIYYVTRYANKVYIFFFFLYSIQDIYLMFGRESTGIPHDILREHPDHLLRLPMVPDARSLNLSNCVAIVAYEVLRQQNFYNLSTHEAIKGEDFLLEENKKWVENQKN